MSELPLGTAGSLTRRELLRGLGAASVIAGAGLVERAAAAEQAARITKGRIQQSVAAWCFCDAGEKWELPRLCRVARQLGCGSVELVDPKDFPILQQHGLVCGLTPNGMPGAPFAKGLNNPRYHAEVIARTKEALDATGDAGFPGVIAFTGYKWVDADDPSTGEIPRDEGAANCVRALKQLAPHAERRGVNLCLEMLNTRDDSHPMKGHPGYQGDDLDYVADIVRRVGSPRVKLLFDLYHVQVMNGDLIRRIRQHAELIGHVHTAGNPGRCELSARQEINFPACMHALLEAGYEGYVGHEFIPSQDPLAGLTQAVLLCDV